MITNLRLQHFRSYNDTRFEFSPGVNIIVGPNGSGKTNLLEAMLIVARGSSYRARDAELMQFDYDWSRLDCLARGQQRSVKIERDPARSATPRKSFIIDNQTVSRLHQSKTLPVVLFEPNHLFLLHGAPEMRRAFLDDLLEQLDPRFGPALRHYRRVLAQRNALLKRAPRDAAEQLFVWNLRLSELGGKIARARNELINTLAAGINDIYNHIAHRQQLISMGYVSRFPAARYESALLQKLEASTELDLERGFTAYGPHRDDFELAIDGHPAQEAASRGETRTLLLALKMLELRLLEASRPNRPLLLLDDVFSELDSARRESLATCVNRYQTFITTTDADIINPCLDARAQVITTSPTSSESFKS